MTERTTESSGPPPAIVVPGAGAARHAHRAGGAQPRHRLLVRARSAGNRLPDLEQRRGHGATGRFFATEWTGVRPDVVVMAKGIASGLPLSGIMARRALMEAFAPGTHGGTYGGNAVACAAAVATARRDRG